MSSIDEISRLLGRMENELGTLRRENEILFKKLSEVVDKLDNTAKASDGFSGIIETVNRHEAIIQKGAGIGLALAAVATTLGLFVKDAFGWVMRKLGY